MPESIRCTTSEENLNTMQRLASNISNNPMIYQRVNKEKNKSIGILFSFQPLLPRGTCATTVQHQISRWKSRFKCRHEHTNHDPEKNQGYLFVVTPDSEPVLLPNESLDHHQQTQHAQPCVQINDISFDLNQIQYSSATAMTPNPSPPGETSLDLYLPSYDIRKWKK